VQASAICKLRLVRCITFLIDEYKCHKSTICREYKPNSSEERELIKVQNLLNERPRKTLNFQTPKEVFLKGILKIEKYKKLLEVL